MCLKQIRDDELDGVDLSSWRINLNAAESVNASVQRRFAERFGRRGFDARALIPAYGMAEASLALTAKPGWEHVGTLEVNADRLASEGVVEHGTTELVSVGPPLAGVETTFVTPLAPPYPQAMSVTSMFADQT